VGAVLRGGSGKLYYGCNVENAAYPESQCAEAGAIGALVVAGETRIDEVLVLGSGEQLVTPCGGCRQRLSEFATAATPVHLCADDGVLRTVTMAELLPMGFGQGHLR
jgi:cytidine deaminase